MSHRPLSPRGFTLVEVLVALVILSIVAGLSWQAVDGMARSRDAVQRAMDRSLTQATALAQWEQDLATLLIEAPMPPVHFDGVRLRLVRARPEGAQLVVWSLRQGLWQRWASAPTVLETELVAQWAAAQQMLGTEPGHVTLARDAQGWQLYFFRGNAWSNAQSSGDLVTAGVAAAQGATAPAVMRERAPQGVRLVLTLSEAEGGTLTRDVLVPGGQP